MKSFLFLIFFLSGLQSFALTPAVRIDLSGCGMQTASQFSGWILSYEGRQFVVTSAWAQLTAFTNEAPCEKIYNGQQELKVHALVTDHLNGLALYEILSPSLHFEILPSSGSANKTVLMDPRGLREGQIIATRSQRHTVPALDRALEWKGSAAPSSIIGAAALKGSEWMGIVSHQILVLVPGSSTALQKWNLLKADTNNHIVVIPSATVNAWMIQQLASPQEPVIWPRQDQRSGRDHFIVGDLSLTATCPTDNDGKTSPPASTENEFPIGGHDGFGIGGESTSQKTCKVQVLKSKQNSPWLAPSLAKWSAKVSSEISLNKSVHLWYGLQRDVNGRLQRGPITSVEGLLKKSLVSDMVWIEDIQPPTLSSDLLPLRQSALDLRSETLKCYNDLYLREESVQDLLRQLFFFSILSSSSALDQLTPADLFEVVDTRGSYALGWKALNGNDLCLGNKIREKAGIFTLEHKKSWRP